MSNESVNEVESVAKDNAEPVSPVEGETFDSDLWGGLLDEGEGGEEGEVSTPAEPEAPAAEEPSTPEPETPEAQPTPEPTAPVPPTAEAQEPPASEPPQPAEPPRAAEQVEDPEAVRAKVREQLEAQYALDEEDSALMISEPEKVIPKLAAKLHMQVLEAAMQGILGQLPGMIQTVQAQTQQAAAAEEEFFSQWPALRSHRDTVMRHVMAVRYAYPNATKEQVIRLAGVQAMLDLKLPLPDGMGVVQTPPPAPAVKPFVPAAQGGQPAPAPAKSTNVFELLAEEFEND